MQGKYIGKCLFGIIPSGCLTQVAALNRWLLNCALLVGWLVDFYVCHSCIHALRKIVQSRLRRHISKAAFELGLHFFLWYLASGLRFNNTLIHVIICFLKASIILNVKVGVKHWYGNSA